MRFGRVSDIFCLAGVVSSGTGKVARDAQRLHPIHGGFVLVDEEVIEEVLHVGKVFVQDLLHAHEYFCEKPPVRSGHAVKDGLHDRRAVVRLRNYSEARPVREKLARVEGGGEGVSTSKFAEVREGLAAQTS